MGVNLYDGQWHYLAISYQANANGSPGTLTGYVDGQSVGTGTTAPPWSLVGFEWALGRYRTSGATSPPPLDGTFTGGNGLTPC